MLIVGVDFDPEIHNLHFEEKFSLKKKTSF